MNSIKQVQYTFTLQGERLPQREFSQKKRGIEETFAKLRQLHDRLNEQLYRHPSQRPTISSPADALVVVEGFLSFLDHEELWVLNLDRRNRVKSMIALYKGSVNTAQVRVAEVFRQAVVDNSPALIICHNHPSGDATPSPDDVALTRALVQAGKLLDIDVLDHIVVGQEQYVSLHERGLGFT